MEKAHRESWREDCNFIQLCWLLGKGYIPVQNVKGKGSNCWRVGEVELGDDHETSDLLVSFSECWCQDINQITNIQSSSDRMPRSPEPQGHLRALPFQTPSVKSIPFISRENPQFLPVSFPTFTLLNRVFKLIPKTSIPENCLHSIFEGKNT